MFKTTRVLLAAAALALPSMASAQTWAYWTAANVSNGTASGTFGSTTINYTGSFDGYQLSDLSASQNLTNGNCANVYFNCNGGGAYAILPSNEGFIQYSGVRRGTITFGAAVVNPIIAFISVGQPGLGVTYDFGSNPFNVISNNNSAPSAFGGGSFSVSGNKITGNEFSGEVQLIGTYSSFSFTVDNPEYWHGMTVGAQSVVPEPSTYALMTAGLLALGVAARRRRKV